MSPLSAVSSQAFFQQAMFPLAGATGEPSLSDSIASPFAEQAFIANIMRDFMMGSMALQQGFGMFAGQAFTGQAPPGGGLQA